METLRISRATLRNKKHPVDYTQVFPTALPLTLPLTVTPARCPLRNLFFLLANLFGL